MPLQFHSFHFPPFFPNVARRRFIISNSPNSNSTHFDSRSSSSSFLGFRRLQELPSSMEETEQKHVYSVWAVPPEHVQPRLRKLMQNLREEFGGPEFEPHITVVGAISLTREDALAKLRSACEGLKPFTARINSVERGTFFYQCVYLLLEPTPEVMETNLHCTSHFGYKSSSSYMPHLSLLYGDLSDEEKERAKEKAKFYDESICRIEFEVSYLALYKTDTEDKTLKSWEKVAGCQLLTGN